MTALGILIPLSNLIYLGVYPGFIPDLNLMQSVLIVIWGWLTGHKAAILVWAHLIKTKAKYFWSGPGVFDNEMQS